MNPKPPAPVGALLTKREAAAYLGIAPRTLDDWRKANAIACIERPGFVRFLISDLEAFLERHRKAPRTVTTFRPRRKPKSLAGPVMVRPVGLETPAP